MAGTSEKEKQGTGKHPHKSTEEPLPHTKKEEGKKSGSGEKASAAASGSSPKSDVSKGEDSDLKSREYRDKDGNIHHHTRTAGKKENE
jgi:hypothetical protein